jgi:hypothetical protein
VIRAFPAFVVGGAVYVWSTDGPEEVDRQFGLVDEHGAPVDDALDTIAELYASTTPAATTLPSQSVSTLAASPPPDQDQYKLTRR